MKVNLWSMMFCALILSAFSNMSQADSSGLDTTKKLNEVAKQDVNKMCDAYSKDAKEIKKGNCTLDALVNAKDEKECNTIRSECKKLIDNESTDPDECKGLEAVDFSDCTVAVGEIEACFSQLVDYAKSLSCDQLGSELPDPPTCMEDLQTQCGGMPDDV